MMVFSAIPNANYALAEKLPDNWNDAADINSLRSLDRSFVFPGICFISIMFLSFLNA